MAPANVLVTKQHLSDLVRRIFVAAGFSDADARIEADVLVWANLRGVESHGIFRVPRYVGAIRSGALNPAPTLAVVREAGPTSIIEADRAAGPVAMTFAMDHAIAAARKNAVGFALVRNTTHTGPVGYYARAAARQGMIGIVTSASRPIMAYHGTRTPAVSTNPLAIAVPCAGGGPLVLDMATAAIAWGKLSQARRAGTPLPENVALDDKGHVTTDPARAFLPLPVAGAKGAGLSLMIECLVSLLCGTPLIAPALLGEPDTTGAWQHGLAIAVDIAAFIDPADFADEAARLARAIRSEPRADGFDEILMPGERGDRVLAEREKGGIPVPADQWRELVEVARSLGIEASAG